MTHPIIPSLAYIYVILPFLSFEGTESIPNVEVFFEIGLDAHQNSSMQPVTPKEDEKVEQKGVCEITNPAERHPTDQQYHRHTGQHPIR